MKARTIVFAALASSSVAASARVVAHPAITHGTAEDGHSADGGHAKEVGNPGKQREVSRTIQVVTSDDIKFTPATIDVQRGETIRFVVKNAGRSKHEMLIGSVARLKQHPELMRKMPDMEHAAPNQVRLAAGKSGKLVWNFTKPGTLDFACLEPAHFDAGVASIIGAVSVS